MNTTMTPLIQFLNKHKIKWFPINLKFYKDKNGKDKKDPIPYKGKEKTPAYTEFPDLHHDTYKLTQMQKLVDEYDYIAIDTHEIQQIDVDDPDVAYTLDAPYFKSVTKGLPHYFIKDTTPDAKKCMYWAGGELLHGQWGWAHKNAEIMNAEFDIPTQGLSDLPAKAAKVAKRAPAPAPTPAPAVERPEDFDVEGEIPFDTLSDIVMSLDPIRAEAYDSWMNVIWATMNVAEANGYEDRANVLVHDFSVQSDKYNYSETRKKIRERRDDQYADELRIGTLLMYLKEDNREKFDEVRKMLSPETDEKPTDYDCAVKLLDAMRNAGHNFVTDNNKMYWYNPADGFYRDNLKVLRPHIATCNALPHDIRGMSRHQDNIMKQLEGIATYEPNFEKQMVYTTKQKFPFNNGVYDFLSGELIPFSPSMYFLGKSKLDYEPNEALEQEVFDKLFVEVFKNEKALYTIQALARSLAGEVNDKTLYVIIGDGNTGKGVITDLCHNTFDAHTGIVNSGDFCLKDGKAESAKTKSWIVPIRHQRFAMLNESSQQQNLDASTMKLTASGGDGITARENYKDSFTFHLQCTFWWFMNDMPRIDGSSDAIGNRVRVIEPEYRFLEGRAYEQNKKDPKVKKADPSIRDVYVCREDVQKAFASLLCKHYLHKKPECAIVDDISKQWTKTDDVETLIKENIIIEPGVKVTGKALLAHLKKQQVDVSPVKLGRIMKILVGEENAKKVNGCAIYYTARISYGDDEINEVEE
jgi:hypothetical protein